MSVFQVLVLNAGSSSLKFALINAITGDCNFQGIADRLLSQEASITIKQKGEAVSQDLPNASCRDAIDHVIRNIPTDSQPDAIGHRVVHGGDTFHTAALITDAVLAEIEAASALAPLHNPANLAGIEISREVFPNLPQVAVFDTGFHSHLPEVAYRYAIPERLYQDHAIRRYGFHGTSHQFVATEAAKHMHKAFDTIQIISAHLGNGCSLCAIKDGHSVDTTMGLTPLEGLVMGSRSGDIDPGIIFWLAENTPMSMTAISTMLNDASGLLGVSGLSNDMRTLEKAREAGDKQAALAIDLFVYRLAKSIAAMSIALDRLDALVFTGGIGENSSLIRAKVIERLKNMGFRLDLKKNDAACNMNIACDDSLPVFVITTNEEWMIARETYQQFKV